tara:strand:+ start:751 stop:1017 length:267 start_codon:yes stop_codon:yes gene_type:complete
MKIVIIVVVNDISGVLLFLSLISVLLICFTFYFSVMHNTSFWALMIEAAVVSYSSDVKARIGITTKTGPSSRGFSFFASSSLLGDRVG